MITLDKFFMGRRELFAKEYTTDLENNAIILLNRVNSLLEELGLTSVQVSSGWRPPSLNATISNAAKKSAHQSCEAIDILDDKIQSLAILIESRPDLLIKYDLYMENKDHTKNWVHLQTRKTKSGNRIFQP